VSHDTSKSALFDKKNINVTKRRRIDEIGGKLGKKIYIDYLINYRSTGAIPW